MDDRPIILNRDPKEKQIFIGKADYGFDDKRFTLGGPLSIFMFVVSAAICGVGIYTSYQAKGNGGIILGAAGFMGILVAICGFVIGVMSFREEDKHYVMSRTGVILNAIVLLLWVCIYLIGI